MKEKRLEQTDAEAVDEEEEPTKRSRTRFLSLQPGEDDSADTIDDEIPGSVRADVEPLVLGDAPFDPYKPGDPRLSSSHMAKDPGWARAQRKLLRMQDQDEHAMEAIAQGEEEYDQPEEEYNEAGDVIEPFHLHKEREEGYIDGAGTYIEYDRPEDRDAWLDSIEDQVEGTEGDAGDELPYPNEPVAEAPPPLSPTDLQRYRQTLMNVLQPGETLAAALRRLAGAGHVFDKFPSKGKAAKAWQERVHTGRMVAPGNHLLFDQVTEAAEVLFDHRDTGVYSASWEDLQRQQRQQERAPPNAAPTPAAAAAVAAAVEGTVTVPQGSGGEAGRPRSASIPTAAGRKRAGDEVMGVREEPLPAAAGEKGLEAGAHIAHHPPHWSALRGERQPAAAAAALPLEGMPSVPGTERELRGPGQEGASHGFAAQVEADLLGELPATTPPPQEVEVGLGVPLASPTEVEQHKRVAVAVYGDPPAMRVDAAASGAPAMKAAPLGQFSGEGASAQRSEG